MYICRVGVSRYWSPRLLKMLVLAINNKSLQQKISTRKCTTEWFHKNMPNRFSPGLGHPMALNLWGAPSRPGSGLAQARAYLLGPGHQKQGERESVFYFYSAQLEFYVPHNIDIDSVAGHFALVVEHCLRVLVWQDPAGKAHAMSEWCASQSPHQGVVMALLATGIVLELFPGMSVQIWSDIHVHNKLNIYSTYILNYSELQGRVLCPIL